MQQSAHELPARAIRVIGVDAQPSQSRQDQLCHRGDEDLSEDGTHRSAQLDKRDRVDCQGGRDTAQEERSTRPHELAERHDEEGQGDENLPRTHARPTGPGEVRHVEQ